MNKEIILGLVRISLGWTFLWAFFDKLLGLGFATEPDKAWLVGGSPTTGFLTFGVKGPFAEFYQSLAGSPFVDWLFMLGLLLIGVTLTFGIMTRWGAIFGALMLVLMYTAGFMPPEHNPVTDDHIIYALVLLSFLYMPVGEWLGFEKQWKQTDLVKAYPWLA